MVHHLGEVSLRPPDCSDTQALYEMKNDPETAMLLGGFVHGYSRASILEWIEFHRKQTNEVVWIIAEADTDQCVGHVGLYQIDYRVGLAEFGIVIGNPTFRGRGLGRLCTQAVVNYGFQQLNLNRISLEVLAINERAANLYHSMGFRDEGRLRQAQYRNGQHLDILLMALLREEYLHECSA